MGLQRPADFDGDIDILIANNGQAPDLLRNEGPNTNNSLLIRTIGSESNRDGIGARLRLSVGEQILVREVKAGSSYLSQNDRRIHFGLGREERIDQLEIQWPSGMMDIVRDIEANQILTVREGEGIVERLPFEGN